MRIMHRIENGYVYLLIETDEENKVWKKIELINLNQPFSNTWDLIKYWGKYNYINVPETHKTIDIVVLNKYLENSILPDIINWLDLQNKGIKGLIGYLNSDKEVKDE